MLRSGEIPHPYDCEKLHKSDIWSTDALLGADGSSGLKNLIGTSAGWSWLAD